ncbi:MAG TPA: insulinase family protein [Burkholderiaceae bacterium]
MFRSLFAWLVIITGLLCMVPARADEPPRVRTLGGISEYRLDNGLQVLLMPVAGSGRAYVTVTYKVGSRMEGPREAGMAHLLEHVTFRGMRDSGGISADLGTELKKLNVGFNGTTTADRTNYFDDFPASDERLKQVLALEAQRMSEARLEQADFDKEKPIVLNEMGLRGDGIARQMLQGLEAGAFKQHPYGRPVIGFTSDIESLSLPTLRAFYEKFYRPDNAVLMIAGEFDPAQALQAVMLSFGAKLKPATPVPELDIVEPAQAAPRLATLHASETAVAVGYHVPGFAHPEAAAIQVMGYLLADVSSTLARDPTRVGSPSIFWRPTRDPNLASLMLPMPRVKTQDADARAKLVDEALGWVRDLERAALESKNDERHILIVIERARSGLSQTLRTPGPASAFISEAIGAGDWRLAFKLQDELNRLKPYDVARAYRTYVRAENRTLAVGVTDPSVTALNIEEKPLSGIASWFSKPVEVASVKDAAGAVGELTTGAQGASAGAAYAIDPAAIDRDTLRQRLPSGILLTSLKRQTANDRVSVGLLFRWASPQRMVNDQGWRALSDQMLEAGVDGKLRLSAEQIVFVKAKIQAEIRIQAAAQGLSVSLVVPRQYLVQALLLVRDLLRAPDMPGATFTGLQGRALTALAAQSHSSQWAPELARQHRMQSQGLQWGDPAYVHSNGELLDIWKKLDTDAVRDFTKRFWSANELQVSAVGPLPDNWFALIEANFGDWKKPDAPAFERLVTHFKPEEGARFVSTRRVGATGEEGAQGSAKVVWKQGFALNELEPDAVAMGIGARILVGTGASGSRLLDRLRGRDAISYSVGYNLHLPRDGDDAGLIITATASPENALRAEAAMREEIERLLKDGITEAELDTARSQFLDSRRGALSNDDSLMGMLMSGLDRNESLSQVFARQDAALQQLTVDSVNAALRRLLLPDRWVVVITGAEKS